MRRRADRREGLVATAGERTGRGQGSRRHLLQRSHLPLAFPLLLTPLTAFEQVDKALGGQGGGGSGSARGAAMALGRGHGNGE
eukprot:13031724-Alexandrium_andersonii.AAC.1